MKQNVVFKMVSKEDINNSILNNTRETNYIDDIKIVLDGDISIKNFLMSDALLTHQESNVYYLDKLGIHTLIGFIILRMNKNIIFKNNKLFKFLKKATDNNYGVIVELEN